MRKKTESYVCARNAWVKGAQPPSRKTMSFWGRVRRPPPRPKNLVTRKRFFARRGAGYVVCTAPTQLKVYEYEKSLCKNIITQWLFILFCLLKVQTTMFDFCFTIIQFKFLRTGTAARL